MLVQPRNHTPSKISKSKEGCCSLSWSFMKFHASKSRYVWTYRVIKFLNILEYIWESMAFTICSLIGEVTITSWEVMVTWEVIITSNNVTICSLLQVTVTSKNFQKFFSISNDVKLPKMPKKAKKKFSKILKIFIWEVTITSNDSYHLLVNSSNGHFSQSDHHFLEVTTRW